MKLDIKIGDVESGPTGLEIDGGIVVDILEGKVLLEDGRIISKRLLLSEDDILKMEGF